MKEIANELIKNVTFALIVSKGITVFCRKYRLVADGALCKGHDVIYILRCSDPSFFALLVEPQVRSAGNKKEE